MSGGRVQGEAGYAGVARSLAKQALAIAIDTAPTRAREGEQRWPMAQALPAARVLLELADQDDHAEVAAACAQLADVLSDPTGKITDGFGHTRPVYAYLALHLLGWAARLIGDDTSLALLAKAAGPYLAREHAEADRDPRLGVWRSVVACHFCIACDRPNLPTADAPTPLMPLGLEDLIDSWTYRELVGLHGLHLFARLTNDAPMAKRVVFATEYHMGHTQPDYTTYQPWGLSAFAGNPQTTLFAEQQLHDVATHLSIEGPGGAVLPALLLADAAATMSGRLDQGA